jgi:small nuclear ribonucleoprotein (snRNP)-like protein
MSEQTADAGAAKTPADFLKSIKGKQVVVKLNSGVDYRGVLACLDGYMNIAMEETEVRSNLAPRLFPVRYSIARRIAVLKDAAIVVSSMRRFRARPPARSRRRRRARGRERSTRATNPK